LLYFSYIHDDSNFINVQIMLISRLHWDGSNGMS
jgi:hypothetical protein